MNNQKQQFDINEITTTAPTTYREYVERWRYVFNDYANSLPHESAFYIGKPTAEQQEAAKNWYLSKEALNYYPEKETAENIDRILHQLEQQHTEQLNNFDYLVGAFTYEFYNFECMISDRYDEATEQIGLDWNSMTETQQNAFEKARGIFLAQVRRAQEEGRY